MASRTLGSVRSKQNKVLRYVVSTDVDKTASDLGVSTDSLRRFLKAKPETVKKHPERFNKLLQSQPENVAKERDVRLVQRLSGKRLSKAYQRMDQERVVRAVRYAQVARQRRRIEENGKVRYVPAGTQKGTIARKQILENLSGYNSATIIEQWKRGELSKSEATTLMRKLWKNSDMTASAADQYLEKAEE